MKSWKSWLLVTLCMGCLAVAIAAPGWAADLLGHGYYGPGSHPPHPPHP